MDMSIKDLDYIQEHLQEGRPDWEKREGSARRIQMYWRSHQDRKLFRLLMNTVRSAEQCVTPAVLRQLSPLEANLLTDRSLQCKVRFRLSWSDSEVIFRDESRFSLGGDAQRIRVWRHRGQHQLRRPEGLVSLHLHHCRNCHVLLARFSGPQFPPVIVFKIFHTGRGGHYLSGKKLLRPSNQATVDSCRMMGNRRFMDLLMEDEVQWHGREISDPTDVTCMRDYIQYSSHLDELPAWVGGRENGWRRLGLQALTRERVTGTPIGSLKKETLSGRPARPLHKQPQPNPTRCSRFPAAPPSSAVSSRRSARAQSLSARMKLLYTHREEQRTLGEDQEENPTKENTAEEPSPPDLPFSPELEEDSQWEDEAEKLCCWTGQLTLDMIHQLDRV
ncbi:hypothetical protein NFI96_023773 [Prochilodus magdalenae]|nr:hypothetical protein NFI96_023773 [Prochilodus magdalenae]